MQPTQIVASLEDFATALAETADERPLGHPLTTAAVALLAWGGLQYTTGAAVGLDLAPVVIDGVLLTEGN